MKKSLILSLLSKTLLPFLLIGMLNPTFAYADPVVGGQILPPASFTRVDDYDLLMKIGLTGGAWCYEDDANAILISAPAHERAKCELTLKFELEKQKTKYEFEISRLKLRLESVEQQSEGLIKAKDIEIEKLTQAALKRPNDYVPWWTAGGFALGTIITTALFLTIK